MRKVVSISLDEEMDQLLAESAESLHTSKSDVVKKALQQFLYLQESAVIRKKMRKYAEKAGFFSEEDIFREIS